MAYSDDTVIKPRPGRARPQPAAAVSGGRDEQTIITPRPRPGGSQQQAAAGSDATLITPRRKASRAPLQLAADTPAPVRDNCSPLLAAAAPLLALPPQLRRITGQVDVQQLHASVRQKIQQFEAQALSACSDSQLRNQASYILCSLIDETVLNTAWGENSSWSQSPLLSLFHQETYGGEKVYQILSQALQTPARYEDILEIIFLALSLGFMGKLRVDPQGSLKTEEYRAQIYEVLQRSRDDLQRQLSPDCQPCRGLGHKLQSFMPVWIVTALLLLGAFGAYSYWLFQLNTASDQTRQLLASVVPSAPASVLQPEQTPAAILSLQSLLEDEIERGFIAVDNFTTHTSITLRDREFFPSGSADINSAFLPILDKLAKALETIPGKVLVSGHTDSRAIRTARYPSNWHLSLARASAVVKHLAAAASLDSRLLPEGRGSEQPLAGNDTPEGRAMNRRVVIDIYYDANLH